MYRRIAVLASLAVMATMFVGSSTANAALGDGGVCVFEGLAGNLNPAIQVAVEDITAGDPLDIEQGSYNFNGDATCVGKVGATVFAPSQAFPQNVSIVSNGHYDNIICGTGMAHDLNGAGTTVTAKPGSTGGGASITGVGYEIPFVAGNGPTLIGTGVPGVPSLSALVGDVLGGVTGKEGTPHGPHGIVTGGYAGAGFVHITPGDRSNAPAQPAIDPDNCVERGTSDTDGDGGVDTFEVAGAFVAVGKP